MKCVSLLLLAVGLVSCSSPKQEEPDMTTTIERAINQETETALLGL
jgi:hypothetical protein